MIILGRPCFWGVVLSKQILENSVLDEFYGDSNDEADSDSGSDSDDSDIDTMGKMMLGMMFAGAATRAMARMFTDTVEN
uniref:Uncharacterized protein n=1 Tax=Meloidogyne incognita TaxID=6306 RepID=A0A914MN21_MELIC